MNVPQALYKIIIVILLIVCLLLLLSILFSHYGSTIPAEDKLWIRKCARPKKKENNWTHASFMMFWISGTGGNPCKGFLGLKVVDFPTKSFWFSAKKIIIFLQKNSHPRLKSFWFRHATKWANTPASYTWNQENHWKSCFFNSVFKWNCIWVTSEKFGSGWGTGLQSVLNRPTKRLEPASNQRSSRKSQRCMPGSASPHSAACPRPPKKVVFWRQSTNFPLLHPGNGHISKTRTKTQLVSFWTDMVNHPKKWHLRIMMFPIFVCITLFREIMFNYQFQVKTKNTWFKMDGFKIIFVENGKLSISF